LEEAVLFSMLAKPLRFLKGKILNKILELKLLKRLFLFLAKLFQTMLVLRE